MTQNGTTPRIIGIIPAAGASRRMGKPKQILPYKNTTIAGFVVRTLLKTDVNKLYVVTQSKLLDDVDLSKDDRLRIVINDDPDSEMIDSIKLALMRQRREDTVESPTSRDTGILVTPADMPSIPKETYAMCIKRFRKDPSHIVVATSNGRRGHPLLFPASLINAVDQLRGGLNQLLIQFADRVVEAERNDSGILKDIDTPRDYNDLTEHRP